MWCLKERKNAENIIYIKQGDSLEIGRKGTDIILSNDGSISRLHARIEVKTPESSDSQTVCLLTDVGSRYGTQIIIGKNKEKLIANEPHELKDNDIVQFGMDEYFFNVQYMPYVILTSGLNREDKITLSEIVDEIGGMICNKWSAGCTHLTVTEAKMTQKLAASLAAGIPIVNIKFWQAVKISKENKSQFPKASRYCPELDDAIMRSGNVNLLPLEGRRGIFKNLTFIFFLKKQLNTYQDMIKLAGGTCVYYDDKINKRQLSAKTTIVIQFSQDESQNEDHQGPTIDLLEQILKKSKRRIIPESEIPLAILHCSTDQSCNPDFSYHELLKRKGTEELERNAHTLVPETQYDDDENSKKLNKPARIIPESIDFTTQELEKQREILLGKKTPDKSSTLAEEKRQSASKISSTLAKNKSIENISKFDLLSLKSTVNSENDKMETYEAPPSLSCIKKKQNVDKIIIPKSMECDDLLDPVVATLKNQSISKKRKSVQLDSGDDNDESFTSTRKKSRETSPVERQKSKKEVPKSLKKDKKVKMELDMADIDEEPFIEPQKNIKQSPVFDDKENSQEMITDPVPNTSKKIIKKQPLSYGGGYGGETNSIHTTWENISRSDLENVGKRFRSKRINIETTKPIIIWGSAAWK